MRTLFGVIGRLLWVVFLLLWYPHGDLRCGVAAASSPCVGDISQTTYDALDDLYRALKGADWAWNTSDPQTIWTFPSALNVQCASPPWYGLSCESLDGSSVCVISSLVLESFGLVGPLPESLADLSHLNSLVFASNELTGPLPDTIGNLKNLTSINVDSNQLTGAVPVSLLQLPRLVNLSIGVNHFDTLPDEIYMPSIQLFFAITNRFHGDLPVSIVNCTTLRQLDFFGNLYDGTIPSEYGLMTQLISLGLDQCKLRGPIPHQLGNLVNLELLTLDNNKLTGTIPSSIGNMRNLGKLALYVNLMVGPIPSELGLLSSLYY
jgi:hypothetical protein